MGWFKEFFGIGLVDDSSTVIAGLSQELEEAREHIAHLSEQFETLRRTSLPNGDDGWGFSSLDRYATPEEIVTQFRKLFVDWRDMIDARATLLTVTDERDELLEQNTALTAEVARLKAEQVLPVELSKDFVPQLAIEARKPRVFDDYHSIPDRVVVRDSEGDYFKIDGGVILFAFEEAPTEWSYWHSAGRSDDPNRHGPFTEVLPRVFQRGDVIPDDVTKLRVAGENDTVERAKDGQFAYNPDRYESGWGPSDTSDKVWFDTDFPLTEVQN